MTNVPTLRYYLGGCSNAFSNGMAYTSTWSVSSDHDGGRTVDPARLTAAQIVTSKLDGEELVHVVAQAFGLIVDGHDKASALGAIEAFLHDEARAGRRCLLVVDESQNLALEALEELRMLSNFQLGAHPLLQTLLLGQPEFRDTIQDHPRLEQLRQRVIAAHHLEAMELGEIQPYIEHRLKCVGWSGNPRFDQRVYTELYEASGGVPRRINQICNRLMMLGAVEQRARIDGAMLSQVLEELELDGTMQLSRPARPVPAAAPANPAAPAAAMPVDAVLLEQLQAMLAERDAQIAELQQAVIELANEQESAPSAISDSAPALGAVEARLAAFEAKMLEQERTIRHTLTMLIEWIEADDASRAAA